mgnify:CR=1 FL=1
MFCKRASAKDIFASMATMSKSDRETKKRLAYTMYVENGFEQKVIAEITGISENTISKWKRDSNWDQDRQELKAGLDNVRKRIIRMYNAWLEQIEQRTPPANVPNSKESDALNKLADAAKKLQTELSLGHKTETGKQFISYIQKTYGQSRAVEIVDLWHEFLMATS